MTVSTTTSTASDTVSSGQHSFSYGFKILAASDLVVTTIDTSGVESAAKVLDTDYVVTNVGVDSGGNVLFKFNTGNASDAHYDTVDRRPTTGHTVFIKRNIPITQSTDYVANDPFPAASHEDALDKLTFVAQQLSTDVDRSIKYPNNESNTVELPTSTERANKFLAFDSSSNPIATSGTTTVPVSSQMETFTQSTSLANARTELLSGTNLSITANTITSTNTNGDINLTCNGTGSVVTGTVDASTVVANTIQLDRTSGTTADITTNTEGDLILDPGSSSAFVKIDSLKISGQTIQNDSGSVTIENIQVTDATISNNVLNGDITVNPNGTGTLKLSGTAMSLTNGGAPAASITDGVLLFAEDVSSSSELRVRDEAGNVTTLSPHNFDLIPAGASEDMAWSYYSEKDGKRINVDMLKALRVLEAISGEKLVYTEE